MGEGEANIPRGWVLFFLLPVFLFNFTKKKKIALFLCYYFIFVLLLVIYRLTINCLLNSFCSGFRCSSFCLCKKENVLKRYPQDQRIGYSQLEISSRDLIFPGFVLTSDFFQFGKKAFFGKGGNDGTKFIQMGSKIKMGKRVCQSTWLIGQLGHRQILFHSVFPRFLSPN